MDYPRIEGITPEAISFIGQWHDEKPYITAHTSGSTGTPKEIRLLKSDIRHSALSTCRRFGIDGNSILALPLSASYIAGKMMIARAILSNARLIISPPANDFKITVPHVDIISIVPSQIPALLSNSRKISTALIGGASIPYAMERKLMDSGICAYATYGMTETCSHVALRKIGESHYSAMPGIEFGIDRRGCLVIKSENMSFGNLTTNDMVNIISPTSFTWLGRIDNVINSGGIKLHAEQIEREIAPLLPPGTVFYITSSRSGKWGEELTIVIEADKSITPDSKQFQTLHPLHRPKRIIHIDNIPRTTSGKIIRTKF